MINCRRCVNHSFGKCMKYGQDIVGIKVNGVKVNKYDCFKEIVYRINLLTDDPEKIYGRMVDDEDLFECVDDK